MYVFQHLNAPATPLQINLILNPKPTHILSQNCFRSLYCQNNLSKNRPLQSKFHRTPTTCPIQFISSRPETTLGRPLNHPHPFQMSHSLHSALPLPCFVSQGPLFYTHEPVLPTKRWLFTFFPSVSFVRMQIDLFAFSLVLCIECK